MWQYWSCIYKNVFLLVSIFISQDAHMQTLQLTASIPSANDQPNGLTVYRYKTMILVQSVHVVLST